MLPVRSMSLLHDELDREGTAKFLRHDGTPWQRKNSLLVLHGERSSFMYRLVFTRKWISGHLSPVASPSSPFPDTFPFRIAPQLSKEGGTA